MSIGNQPLLIYINQSTVTQQVNQLQGGQIDKVVEEYSKTKENTKGGGVNIYGVLQGLYERMQSSTETTIKEINKTRFEEFATYHAAVEDLDTLHYVTNLTENEYNEFENNEFVEITGDIWRTPLNLLDFVLEDVGLYSEIIQDKDDEKFKEQLKKASQYYEIPFRNEIHGEMGSFIFELNDEYYEPVAKDFPDKYTKYTVLAEIRRIYQEGEEDHQMDLLDYAKPRSHQERHEQKLERRKMIDGVNEFVEYISGHERRVNNSDFKIKHPDILLNPIAIYR